MKKIATLAAVGLTAVWLAGPAFADSDNGNGGGQDNGKGCGIGNTSADCTTTPGGTEGGAGGCISGADLTGCVIIGGNVTARCAMTLDSATIHLGELADNDSMLAAAVVNAGTANLTGWCNGTNATMQVEATPLTTATTPPSGFTNRIDFVATASEGAATATDDSAFGGAGTASAVGSFSGNVGVALSGANTNGSRLVGGSYTGSVLVTLSPGL
jgi:hypothetical protein